MDIVLNTTFDNPYLPVAVFPGFTDDFSAADGPLDFTTDGKAWTFSSASAVWVRDTGEAKMESPGVSSRALVDGLASDGVITMTIGTLSDGKMALVFRYVDESNYFYVTKHTDGYYRCFKRKANVITVPFGTTTTPADGDVVAITLNGSSITARVNGVIVGTDTDSDFLTSTTHGMSASATDYDGTIDKLEFVAEGGEVVAGS